jgi:NADPH2:quinone reductase
VKAAVLEEIGKAPKWEEFEEPVAGEGEALVRVLAASLKPVDKQLAAGTHFASPREADLPVICGTDGVGELEDGTRAFFGGCRKPFGAMAELTVVPRAFCFPLPAGINNDTAAALPNRRSKRSARRPRPCLPRRPAVLFWALRSDRATCGADCEVA